MTPRDFCESLARQSPDVTRLLAEHISDNDELLPHLFLADVTRYVAANGPDRVRIVRYLDKVFSSEGPDVEDLIAVSFVEHLVTRDELERATEGVSAPHIREEWFRQREA